LNWRRLNWAKRLARSTGTKTTSCHRGFTVVLWSSTDLYLISESRSYRNCIRYGQADAFQSTLSWTFTLDAYNTLNNAAALLLIYRSGSRRITQRAFLKTIVSFLSELL
jgi:hypothetical protein